MDLFSFTLGILSGVVSMLAYLTWATSKMKKSNMDTMRKIRDKMVAAQGISAEKQKFIKDSLSAASKIAEQQADIRGAADSPSKNSLHSKHKNGLIGQYYELEAEKISLLKGVLAEGFDPFIMTYNSDGQQEEIKLSVYVAEAEGVLAEVLPPTTPTKKNVNIEEPSVPGGPRKAGKFMIYTGGGKDDEETTH